MRICAQCGGGLEQGDGYDVAARDRGGSALEVDEFRCTRCGVQYRHRYEERFSGDIESWSFRVSASDSWQFLDQAEWPTSGRPTAITKASAPDRDSSVVHLPHFNNQAVLVYDRATGEQHEITKERFGEDSKYWRGFYLRTSAGFIGFYATPDGPMLFVDTERQLAKRGVTKASVVDENSRRRFKLEHGSEVLAEYLYTPGPSGFDAWSQDGAIVDMQVYLAENTNDPKWYEHHTVAQDEDPTWRDRPEPDPGPHFGEYLFVWNSQTEEFLERFRVLFNQEALLDFPVEDRATWTGSVHTSEMEELMAALRSRYPTPPHLIIAGYGDDCTMAQQKIGETFAGTILK